MFEFKTKARIIHGFYGIGTVDSIETKTILDNETKFVTCRFPRPDGELELMVNPRHSNGLIRTLVKPSEIPLIWEYLESYDPGPPVRYNVRNRYFENKLKSVEVRNRCEVVKELYALSVRKPLGRREKEMYDLARGMLVDELSLVSGKPREGVEAQVDIACCA